MAMKASGIVIDRRYFYMGLASYASSLIGVFAGGTLYIGNSLITPSILSIIPIMLGLRGAVTGIFVGRYTTSLHLGLINKSVLNMEL